MYKENHSAKQYNPDSSTLLDIIRRPSAIGLIGLGAVAATVFGVSAGSNSNPEKGAFAVCTGAQEVPVHAGNTLEGLIEANVKTNSEDHLKSDENLNRIAHAVTAGVDGQPLFVYKNNEGVGAKQLQTGDIEVLPLECHVK